MPDPEKKPEPRKDRVRLTSDCEVIELREEDGKPGKPSESLRKWLEQKHGKKAPPSGPETGESK